MTTNPDEEPNHLSQLMMEGLRHRRHHAATSAGQQLTSAAGGGAGGNTATAIPTTNIVTEESMNRETQARDGKTDIMHPLE
jgi:hypothetical protein